MKNFDYKGSYINKTDHHIYIAPSEELKDIIAHYKVPSLDDWEVVLDLRPKMESL